MTKKIYINEFIDEGLINYFEVVSTSTSSPIILHGLEDHVIPGSDVWKSWLASQ
jgi:hypothetical protein